MVKVVYGEKEKGMRTIWGHLSVCIDVCTDVTCPLFGCDGTRFGVSCQVLCVVSCDGLWDLAQVSRSGLGIPDLAYDHIVYNLDQSWRHVQTSILDVVCYGLGEEKRATSFKSPVTRWTFPFYRHDSRRKNRGNRSRLQDSRQTPRSTISNVYRILWDSSTGIWDVYTMLWDLEVVLWDFV
jgi:hypothetical protein